MSQHTNQKGHPLGVHRVLDALPRLVQAAQTLDARLPIYTNELLIQVDCLQIDSASFKQLSTQYPSDADLKDAIFKIVQTRGKMQNPVTGSGGMLLGTVTEIGSDFTNTQSIKIGDKIATLISLTATPLQIQEITRIERNKERVHIKGHAILFERSIFAKMPHDLSEGVALAAFDICGAPLLVKESVKVGDTVLLMGLGKAGKSVLAMLNLEFGNQVTVLGIDPFEGAVNSCQKNFKGTFAKLDATNVLAVMDWVKSQTQGVGVDFVVNAANVADTEMSAILSAKPKGQVLFFGMATDFQKAALGAEAVAQDVFMRIGSGYVAGHADYMMDLLRRSPELLKNFTEHYG